MRPLIFVLLLVRSDYFHRILLSGAFRSAHKIHSLIQQLENALNNAQEPKDYMQTIRHRDVSLNVQSDTMEILIHGYAYKAVQIILVALDWT